MSKNETPKTRPMNFNEVCALVQKGCMFIFSDGVRVHNPKISQAPMSDRVNIDGYPISCYNGYILPDEMDQRPLEMVL